MINGRKGGWADKHTRLSVEGNLPAKEPDITAWFSFNVVSFEEFGGPVGKPLLLGPDWRMENESGDAKGKFTDRRTLHACH